MPSKKMETGADAMMDVCEDENERVCRVRRGGQLKPSKWPLRILSPMGDGARRRELSGLLMVADRRGLRSNGTFGATGLTAEFGGGLGIDGVGVKSMLGCGVGKGRLEQWGAGDRNDSALTLEKAGPESERRRKIPVVRSAWASGRGVGCVCCANRPATVVLALRA